MVFFRQSLKASPSRRPAQVFAGRLLVLAGADGGEIVRRHDGQREEETQPSVRPHRPRKLPGQLQVRALRRVLVAVSRTGLPRACVGEAQQRGSAPAEAADAADACSGETPQRGLNRPRRMKHVAVPHVLLLGVSAPWGTAEASA